MPIVGGSLREEFLNQPRPPEGAAADQEIFDNWAQSLRPDTRIEEKLYLVGYESPDERQDWLDLIDIGLIEIAAEHAPGLAESFARGLLANIQARKGGTI